MPDADLPEQQLLFQLLGGFIKARWLFVSCLGLAIVLGAEVFQIDFPLAQTAVVGVIVFAYNVLFYLHHRYRCRGPVPQLTISRIEAGLQIGMDLLALTALVHFAGGPESPFICLYLIHAIAGGMLLSYRQAWLVAAAAFALFLSIVILEHNSVLAHYHPSGLFGYSDHWGLFEVAVSLALLVTLLCSVYISTWTMNGLRDRERQLVLIQQALLKNSEDLKQAYASLSQQQNQLVQTEKQASLGRLVAGIAHEINNPIQFIHGNMAIISEAFSDILPMLDEKGAQQPDLRIARLDYPFFRRQLPVLLKDMADGSARIRAIVRDLRTFARRDENQLEENVDLTEAVEASVRLLHNQLKHFRVDKQLAPDLPRLRGNLTQLQQVVVNALQNACQAMQPDGAGKVRIATSAEQDGQWVRLTIEDNGCGIPADVIDHIFDPFFTTKQRSGGTGLGLAISEGIMQKHQGRIEVVSQVGKGAAFHFLLPVRRDGAR